MPCLIKTSPFPALFILSTTGSLAPLILWTKSCNNVAATLLMLSPSVSIRPIGFPLLTSGTCAADDRAVNAHAAFISILFMEMIYMV